MSYNTATFRITSIALSLAVIVVVGCLFGFPRPRPSQLVSPSWSFAVAMVPPGSNGQTRPVIVKRPTKLDERFVVVWPPELKVAIPEVVVVKIAANDYEDLLDGIDPSRKIKKEHWKGDARLEATLTPDSGLEVVKQHSDVQVVIRGERHREWSWSIWPKTTGPHQLTLLVQGINGSIREDYDPEVMQFEVAFNPWYWISSGVQQNGISWAWTIIILAVTNACTYWLTRFSTNKASEPTSIAPQPDPPEKRSEKE